jgi:membrane-associated protease RseP (regulator of RpoE activity)
LVHELGHALLVQRYRLRVFSIEIHALGGACWHEPAPTRIAESVIAWGGVLGQLVLLGAALSVLALSPPEAEWTAAFWAVMLRPNLTIMAINLLPVAPLDGARAWQLPKLLLARRRGGRKRKAKQKERAPAAKPRERSQNLPELRLVRDKDGDFRFETDDEDKR